MTFWPLIHQGHKPVDLVEILPENTLIYFSYTCQKSRLCVDKIVFEAHEDPTEGFFLYTTIFCPVILK